MDCTRCKRRELGCGRLPVIAKPCCRPDDSTQLSYAPGRRSPRFSLLASSRHSLLALCNDKRPPPHREWALRVLSIAPPGVEPGVFCSRGRRVASYTTGHRFRDHQTKSRPRTGQLPLPPRFSPRASRFSLLVPPPYAARTTSPIASLGNPRNTPCTPATAAGHNCPSRTSRFRIPKTSGTGIPAR